MARPLHLGVGIRLAIGHPVPPGTAEGHEMRDSSKGQLWRIRLLLIPLLLAATGCRTKKTTVINNPPATTPPTKPPNDPPGDDEGTRIPVDEARQDILDAYWDGYDEGYESGLSRDPEERRKRWRERVKERRERFKQARNEVLSDILGGKADRFEELKKAWMDANGGKDFTCGSSKDPVGPKNLECWRMLCPAVGELIDRRPPSGRRWKRRRKGPRKGGKQGGQDGEQAVVPDDGNNPDDDEIDLKEKGIDLPDSGEISTSDFAEYLKQALAAGKKDGEASAKEDAADREERRKERLDRWEARVRARLKERLPKRVDEALGECDGKSFGYCDSNDGWLPSGK